MIFSQVFLVRISKICWFHCNLHFLFTFVYRFSWPTWWFISFSNWLRRLYNRNIGIRSTNDHNRIYNWVWHIIHKIDLDFCSILLKVQFLISGGILKIFVSQKQIQVEKLFSMCEWSFLINFVIHLFPWKLEFHRKTMEQY